jgi:glycyl-tRNA synthetase
VNPVEIKNFQEFIIALCNYWVDHGCIWSQPYDANMGAGTFHPHTFLKGVGPEPWRSIYVQSCRRPVDGRYGKSPYRFQHYYQLQVLLKPSPSNIVDIFLKSLEYVGINLKNNDIGLLEDDWKGPTLGAWGLGWEIRANGQEVTQFTYFQQLGGLDIDVVCGEITYGLERLFMYSKGYHNALDMPFNEHFTYGDIFYQNEYEFSHFNFNEADIKELFRHFGKCEEKVSELCEKGLVLPAYDYVLQASHSFNLLDARGAISVSERQRYIGRVRDCAKKCAVQYRSSREKLGFPMLNRLDTDARKPIFPNGVMSNIATDLETNFYKDISEFSTKDNLNILFELGVEEMPPSFQMSAKNELEQNIYDFVSKENLNWFQVKNEDKELKFINGSYKVEVSSRRISVQFKNIPKSEQTKKLEIWGPVERIAKSADGSLSQAGIGFCKKNNIDPITVIFKVKSDGKFIYAEKNISGRDFPTLLSEKFKDWCYGLSAPLKMKWLPIELSPPFIRPVRWIIALVEDKLIPIEMFGLNSGRKTCGQRILHPEEVIINSTKEYENILKNISVELSVNDRKSKIIAKASELASEKNGNLQEDLLLLEKCTGLFENPYVFIGNYDEKYLRLPKPLISSVLREHMNYFSVETFDGKNLLPYYIGVANYKCTDIEQMIEGTKTVVVGRIEDGAFYYDSDIKTPIADFRSRLKDQLFQAGMGSLYEKTERISIIVSCICKEFFPQLDLEIMDSAAKLCKADLKSGCVQEFPDEMQGFMGGVLIREQNIFNDFKKSFIAANAIEEHYMPSGAHSPLPSTMEGVVLSLADKLDSLCMMICHGNEVKGSKDPFGMRRLALGIARLLGIKGEENSISISLKNVVDICLKEIQKNINVTNENKIKIYSFVVDRMKAALDGEFDSRSIEALSLQLIEEPLSKVRGFANAIALALTQSGKGSLLEALVPYKRAKNLIHGCSSYEINTSLFIVPEEVSLYEKLMSLEIRIKVHLKNAEYRELLITLASLAEPMAVFFDNVMVNDPDEKLKRNRLSLLMKICSLYEDVADFSLIQVQ